MTPEQGVLAGATAALVLALACGLPRPDRRTLRPAVGVGSAGPLPVGSLPASKSDKVLGHPAVIGAGVLLLLSLIVRAVFVQPTLVHADVIAPELVDCVLQFPHACTGRGATYGQYGFLVIGALTRLFGSDLSAVFRAMELIGALDIVLLAILAIRLSGSAYGGLLAVAATGTNPIFMRVAASEDMHNMGLCLGLVGFIAMDAYAVTRRTAALVAAVLALCLMIHTRQTFHVFAPGVFLLGLARGGRGLLRCRSFWGAGVVVLAVLLWRTTDRAASSNLMENMIAVFTEPRLLTDMLRYHPLLDVVRFGPLPILTVAAVIWAGFAGRVARATAIVFAANFLVTYPCGMPSPGVELAQRLPAFAFGILLVSMGGAALLETRVRPAHRAVAGLLAAGALIALPPLFPGWRVLSALTPIHREYLAVESAAAAIPQQFTLVTVPAAAAALTGYARYAGLLARMGKRVQVASAAEAATMPRPWLFLENIECWTYSFRELAGVKDEGAERHTFQFRWDHVLFGRQPSPLRPPAGARPECQPLLRGGTPIGPRHVVTNPEDDPPFLFYASSTVPVQFHEIGPPPRE